MTAAFGRVRMWRGGLRFGLSVPAPFVWRCLNSRTITPFPHPPHRTGHANFSHPALGQDITPSYAKSPPYSTRLNNSELCYPGVQQASVIPTTTTATTWVVSRFPINLEFFLHFSMQYFLQFPYVIGVDRVTPISCTSPRPIPVLN